MITYTPEQVLENIKAIAECREEDINLPLARLKREMPKELKDALDTAYKKTYRQSEKYKEYQKKYRQSEKYKEYQKKYRQSEKYKEYHKKYYQSEKYKEYKKKYYQNKNI